MSPGLLDQFSLTVVERFRFSRRDHPDRLQQTPVVPPVDPFEASELDVVDPAPWTLTVDQLGLKQPDYRLRECIVERVAAAADALDAAGLGEAFGVADR